MSDDSDLGNRLSFNEANTILTTLDDAESRATLSKFLDRWNNSMSAWENGTLNELADTGYVINLSKLTSYSDQYVTDMQSAKTRGFETIFEEYSSATDAYITADQQSQVCLLFVHI